MSETPPPGVSASKVRRHGDGPDRPRRFYKMAEAAPLPDGGFGVLLDGRALKTPQGAPMTLPTAALAALIAQEWAAQATHIVLPDMAATRLAYTALDRVAGARAAVAGEVARYAGADLLCYFADQPAVLAARQAERWGPVLDWAKAALGLELVRTTGIIHRPQPAATLARVEALAAQEDGFSLSGLAWGAGLLGSAVLALALRHGRIGGAEAYALSRLDEDFQAEQWGVDEEAAERALGLLTEAERLERWFSALA